MITAQFLGQIFKGLKKWLSRLPHSSASLMVSLLLFLRRFAAPPSRLGDRSRRCSSGATSIEGDGAREDVTVSVSSCSSLPGRILLLDVAGDAPSLSDDPYISSTPLQNNREIPQAFPEADPTTKVSKRAAEPYGLPSETVSSLHLSQQTRESPPPSPRIPNDQKGKGVERGSKGSLVGNGRAPLRYSMQTSADPAQSPCLGPHGPVSASQSRTPSVTSHGSHYYSATSASSTRTSRSRHSAYRTHVGPVHSRPVSIRSFADPRHGSGPAPASGIDDRYHLTAPPGSDGEPGALLYSGPQIGGMVPSGVKRYARCNPRATDNSNTTVPAMTITFPLHDQIVPPGWVTVVHPEGCRYFLNTEKRTFTEINICDEECRGDIEYYMQYLLSVLESELKDRNLKLDMKQVDLVIEPKESNGFLIGNYYFANHDNRCLFWLDDFDAQEVLEGCKGINSLSHTGFEMQAQYWRHWDYFPSLCSVSQSLIDEVENLLVYATCDHLTSKESSAAYCIDDLREYLSVIKRIKVSPADSCIQQCHAAILIGRIMHVFRHNAFINFHGEDCARLSYDQTVHGWAYKPSWWMIFFTPVLFLEPLTQVQELHKIFVDRIVRTSRWNAFSSRLKGQLQNSNLLATVLLNANVAFLGVSKGSFTAVQVASYMSLVASFGSIVLGLFFVSQDRASGQSTADEAAPFLGELHHGDRGLQSLAIIYSLPKALLIWGMVFFFAAFSIYWCTSGNMISRVLVGILTLLVLVMIGISVVRAKEGDRWWKITQEIIERAKMVDNELEAGGDEMDAAVDGSLHSSLPNASIFTASTASVHSPRRRDGGSFMSHSPHIRPSASLPSGIYSGYIREGTQTVSRVHPTGEVRYEPEPDRAHSHVHFATPTVTNIQLQSDGISTKTTTPSEHGGQFVVVANDSDAAATLPSVQERGNVEIVSEEPEEQLPQAHDSTSSLPRFRGKAATGDDFRYALETDNRDIAETQDE